jgi:hypothetical protein
MRAVRGLPDPHPLDFDWRFTRETVARLIAITANAKRILVVGAPSVAAELSRIGRAFVGIDRQPPYVPMPVGAYHTLDLRYDAVGALNLGSFDAAILDPPWYPDDAQTWIAQISPLVEETGYILLSVWPPEVRDDANRERLDLIKQAEEFGQIKIDDNELRYLTPFFEQSALKAQGKDVRVDWRRGALATIIVGDGERTRAIALRPRPKVVWERFVLDDYQLALRRPPALPVAEPELHRVAEGWVLPDVSRRNPLRTGIDLWTSNNLAARVQGTRSFLHALIAICDGKAPECAHARRALDLLSAAGFIYGRPYRRTFRWRHFE